MWQISVRGAEGSCARALFVPSIGHFRVWRRRFRVLRRARRPRMSRRCPCEVYEGPGFWELPIPVMNSIDVDFRDVVIYDGEGYPALREFLKRQAIRHVLLTGYNTDMCVCSTTAGYTYLAQDFDVFLVGDATIATFPAQPTPRFATTSSVCFAALNLFITQASWVRPVSVASDH
jgi:Isochorismatase family